MADRNAYCCFCRAFHIPGQPHVKTFPEVDRRKPTANDRAVERIKALCESRRQKTAGAVQLAAAFMADAMLAIICEEAERG